jgi:hypothetical protein
MDQYVGDWSSFKNNNAAQLGQSEKLGDDWWRRCSEYARCADLANLRLEAQTPCYPK